MKDRSKGMLLTLGILLSLLLSVLLTILYNIEHREASKTSYENLKPDTIKTDPILGINEDWSITEDFVTNLPIAIMKINGELPDYKTFTPDSKEIFYDVEPYTTGHIELIDTGMEINKITDTPQVSTNIQLKKRGHSSYLYDKPQYLIKTVDEEGLGIDVDFYGMGAANTWVLNGSLADKSMMRNYLAYRIASEITSDSPDSRYCEVLLEQDGKLYYQGVYLMVEAISRGTGRVDIDKFNPKNPYTSYIVRRDRFTNFDLMLDTGRRLEGLSNEWIGMKYPSPTSITKRAKEFIEKDFTNIEKIVYSDKLDIFNTYPKYIDVDSFVDYFLINEFFGNYDAGTHSTYMYKTSGGKLKIGPIWDFDQAMDNYFFEAMNTEIIAFQTKPMYEALVRDKYFIDKLKTRLINLQKTSFSNENIISIIEETDNYLKSAKQREWLRWSENYLDNSRLNLGSYYLLDSLYKDEVISRFTTRHEQELYVIRTYLRAHNSAIQRELTNLYDFADTSTGMSKYKEIMLLLAFMMLTLPLVLIQRR